MPTGKPSAAPAPQSATPTSAIGRFGARPKMSSPPRASAATKRSTAIRPCRSRSAVPPRRIPVIAVTKSPNPSAPTASWVWKPSTMEMLSQSFAAPSVSAAANTSTPTSKVRDSRQVASARRPWARAELDSGGSTRPPAASGRNERTDTSAAARVTAAAITRCRPNGMPAHEASAPVPAPAIVPNEKPAWNRGMSERPCTRSTTPPSRFIAASQTPLPRPVRTSPTTSTTIEGSAMPAPITDMPSVLTPANMPRERRAPNRSTTSPLSGRPISAPTEAARSTRPSREGERSSASRAAGTRDAQFANMKPFVAKTATTAQVARLRTRGEGIVTVPPPARSWHDRSRAPHAAGHAHAHDHGEADDQQGVPNPGDIGDVADQRWPGQPGDRRERGHGGDPGRGPAGLVGSRREPDRHGKSRARSPCHDSDARQPEGRRDPEDEQPPERDEARDAQHRDAAVGVDQAGTEQPDQCHGPDEDPEDDATHGLGPVESVDDGDREPVVRGTLGQGGRQDDDADQDGPPLTPRAEGVADPGRPGGSLCSLDRRPRRPRAALDDHLRDGVEPDHEREHGDPGELGQGGDPECRHRCPEQRPEHRTDREPGVELGQDRTTDPALDGGRLDVQRDVSERERRAHQEDTDRDEWDGRGRGADPDDQVGARERDGRDGHYPPATEPGHQVAGHGHRRERADRTDDQHRSERRRAESQHRPNGREAGQPARGRDAQQSEHHHQEPPRARHIDLARPDRGALLAHGELTTPAGPGTEGHSGEASAAASHRQAPELGIESIRSRGTSLPLRWPRSQSESGRCDHRWSVRCRCADRHWPMSPPGPGHLSRPPPSRSPELDRSPTRPERGSATRPRSSRTPAPVRSVARCEVGGPGSWASCSATSCGAGSGTRWRSRFSTAWSEPSATSVWACSSSRQRWARTRKRR